MPSLETRAWNLAHPESYHWYHHEYRLVAYATMHWVWHVDQAGPKRWAAFLTFLQTDVLGETTIKYHTDNDGAKLGGNRWMHLLALLGHKEMLHSYLCSVNNDGTCLNMYDSSTSTESLNRNLQRNDIHRTF